MSITRYSLRELLDPVTAAGFVEEYWETKPLVVRRQRRGYFQDLLRLADVEEVLSNFHLRYPQVVLVDATRSIEATKYAGADNTVDRIKIFQEFQDGGTIIVNQAQNCMPRLAGLCRALTCEISAPCQTNLYLTPAKAKGFKAHHDTHDVFVLQVAGSKRWRIYRSQIVLPLNGQEHDPNQVAPDSAEAEFDLEAGDTLYIPRGIVHEAQSGPELSLHVTLGVLSFRWAEVLIAAVAGTSIKDSAFRRGLPIGFAQPEFNRSQARQTFRDLLGTLATTADFDATLDSFVDQLRIGCPPELDAQLEQIEHLGALSSDSIVGAREDLVYRIWEDGDRLRLGCGPSEISFPIHVKPSLDFALAHGRFVVRDLPGELDEDGKLVLARRLIREGVLRHFLNCA